MTTDDAIMNIVRECRTEADVYRAIQESHELLRQAGEALRPFVDGSEAMSSVDQSVQIRYGNGNVFGMIHSKAFKSARAILALIDARAK